MLIEVGYLNFIVCFFWIRVEGVVVWMMFMEVVIVYVGGFYGVDFFD